jgi:hypothetical protein
MLLLCNKLVCNLHEFFSKQITRYIHVGLIVNNTAPVSVPYPLRSALDYSSKIISLGDYNIDFLGNLPTEIADIINLYGTPKLFVPPSARRNFFLSAPLLTWNPGSAPDYDIHN